MNIEKIERILESGNLLLLKNKRNERYLYDNDFRMLIPANRNLWRDFLNFPYFTGFPAP